MARESGAAVACLAGMLPMIDLWGALMVPMLFGDARAVGVKDAPTVAQHMDGSGTLCDFWDMHRLLVEVAADGVYIEDSHADVTVRVDRGIGGQLDVARVAMALHTYKRNAYFVDHYGLLLAPSADGGVDLQDLVAALDAARVAGFSDFGLTTARELEIWSQVDDRYSWHLAPSRVVLEDCWRYDICP